MDEAQRQWGNLLKTEQGGHGCITRDDLGRVCMAAAQLEILHGDPLEVKLQAILRGMQLCLPMGIPKLEVETDCLVAIQALDAGPDSFAAYHHLLREILTLKYCFEECMFSYLSRLDNRVAHMLASSARIIESTAVWWNSPPDFILSVLWLDSNCNL